MNKPKDFLLKNRAHNLCYLMVIFVYLVPRLFFYFGVPVPGVDGDSLTYWKVAYEIDQLEFPMFNIRTPGYPLTLYILSKITDNLIIFCLFQSIVFFVSFANLFLILIKQFPKVKWLLTIAFMVFCSNDVYLRFETTLLAETYYFCSIAWAFSMLIKGIYFDKKKYWLLASLFIGIGIAFRPTALFSVPLFALIGFYYLIKFKTFYKLIYLFSPMLIVILCINSYNYFSLGKFTISPWSVANFIGVTTSYMEPSVEYDEEVNKAIENTLNKVNPEDKDVIMNSWNLADLENSFYQTYLLNLNYANEIIKPHGFEKDTIMKYFAVIDRISKDAISRHPILFVKFWISSFYGHLMMFTKENYNFFSGIIFSRLSWIENTPIKNVDKGAFSNGHYTDDMKKYAFKSFYKANIESYKLRQEHLTHNFFFKLYDFVNMRLSNYVLHSYFVLFLFFGTFIFAGFIFIKSKFNNKLSMVVLLFGIAHLLHITLTSMLEVALKRYIAPTEYFVFICLALIPLLIESWKKTKEV